MILFDVFTNKDRKVFEFIGFFHPGEPPRPPVLFLRATEIFLKGRRQSNPKVIQCLNWRLSKTSMVFGSQKRN
jgi:hypothetical protein